MNNDLKDYWNNKNFKEKKSFKNEKNININYDDSNKSNILISLIALGSITAVAGLYFYIQDIKQIENEKIRAEQQRQIQEYNNHIIEENRKIREQNLLNQKKAINSTGFTLVFDNRYYSNNFNYSTKFDLYKIYKDSEFVENLKPFFNNLSNVTVPNEKIYNFQFKGLLTRYGNFTYVIYKRTNIKDVDEKIISELERYRKIKFRNQNKDIDFNVTLTNQYHLIK